jgi:selenocysteine lyase/cysteine desulfurase
LFHSAHQTVSEFFHVDPARLLLTPSCTAALNLAVMDHSWRAGDRVVTSSFEHHALHRALVKLTEGGVEVTTLPRGTNELISLKTLEQELIAGRVRLVALTAACNVTGQLLPISRAIRLAHEFGALALIDGAQIAGWWDLDVTKLGVDLFTFAGHKGPQAPWGIGGLFVSPSVLMNCPSAACELSVSPDVRQCTAMPGYCDAGSVNLSALAGLATACRWLREPETADRLRRARHLADRFAEAVRCLPGMVLHHDVPAEKKVPTVALTIDSASSTDVATKLRQHGIIASGGYQCAPQAHQAMGTDRSGVIRFSFGPQNRDSEIEQAVGILKQVSSTYR